MPIIYLTNDTEKILKLVTYNFFWYKHLCKLKGMYNFSGTDSFISIFNFKRYKNYLFIQS